MNSSAVVVARCGRPSRSRVGPGDRPVEPALGRHDHPLGEVAQHRVGRAAERPPRAVAPGAPGLAPHDLAPQQQAQPVLQDADDVGRQRAVGLAPQVGHVDRDAAARLELGARTRRTRPRAARCTRCTTPGCPRPQLLLVLLAGEVRRRGDHQRHRRGLHPVHRAGVAQVDLVDHARRLDRRRRRTAPAARTACRTRPSRGSRGGTRRTRRSPSAPACARCLSRRLPPATLSLPCRTR